MKTYLIPSFKLSLILLILCSVLYPLAISGLALLSPGGGNGEVLRQNEKVVGYVQIGQSFCDPKYFQGRPSAVNYNAAGSGGSNKAPSNPEYLATVQSRIDALLKQNPGLQTNEIPSDLVTVSGSGLDPHISVQAARIQVKRIAAVRKLTVPSVEKLVNQFTERPLLGMFGPEKVHVLRLNLALDQLNTSSN